MMRVMICTLTTIGFLAAAGAVLAQATGPNGGLLGGSGGHHQTELVVSSTELTVYLLEDGKAHETKGTKARAVVQQGGKTTTLSLADQGGKLVAKLPSPLGQGAVVVVTGKDGHGDQFSARYVIK